MLIASFARPGRQVIGALLTAVTLAACGAGAASSPAVSSPAASASPSIAASTAASVSAPASASAAAKPAASASTSAPASAASKAPASKLPTLNVGYSGVITTQSPLWLAAETHAFEQHGVSVNLKFVASAAATPTLVNREMDVFTVAGAPVITADLNGGLDEVMIGVEQTVNNGQLYVVPTVKSGADLKGKVVLSDKPGTPTDFYTRQLMTKLGLGLNDVQWLRVGGSEVSVPAFLAGQGQAVGVTTPASFQLEARGYTRLTDVIGTPYFGIGYVVLRKRIDELAPALPGFLAAIQDGIRAFNTQPDLAKRVLQQYTKETDADILDKSYHFFADKNLFNVSLQPNIQSIQEMLDFLAETVPAAKNAKPEQFIDTRFLSQLPKN